MRQPVKWHLKAYTPSRKFYLNNKYLLYISSIIYILLVITFYSCEQHFPITNVEHIKLFYYLQQTLQLLSLSCPLFPRATITITMPAGWTRKIMCRSCSSSLTHSLLCEPLPLFIAPWWLTINNSLHSFQTGSVSEQPR